MLRVVELFAGVGGFRLGLERASKEYKTVWANQWEPGRKSQHAFDCYTAHFGDSSLNINIDIAIAKNDVPAHDLLVGGFPCQDYSVARTGAEGILGKKGVLWWEIRDILESKRPSYILLENVDRLLKSPASQRGRDFGVILYCLKQLDYSVEWRVINAAEYGFAQKRRRTFLFAVHDRTPLSHKYKKQSQNTIIYEKGLFARAFPVADNSSPFLSECGASLEKFETLTDVSDGFKYEFDNAGVMVNGIIYSEAVLPRFDGHITRLRDILESGVDEKYYITGNLEKWVYLKGSKREIRYKPNGEPYYYTEGAIPYPDNLDSPARTMLTSETNVNRSSHIILDPVTGRERVLTQVECERINGFPDNWTATGMPDKFRYFVMGNALVVGVVEQIGKTLFSLLSENE
ncbi:cytosine-specific methyltransferase [Clostridia bacterium]|nr:cytosine-specific methyltransferase [Clostridia bacterium]